MGKKGEGIILSRNAADKAIYWETKLNHFKDGYANDKNYIYSTVFSNRRQKLDMEWGRNCCIVC